jgi:general secretion pathway protein K
LLAGTFETALDRSQSAWILRGGLDWARVILLDDARRNSVTRAGALWAQPIVGLQLDVPGSTEKATFSGRIEDEQSKFNLMSLARGGQIQPEPLSVVKRLLGSMGISPQLGDIIAQRVAHALEDPSSSTAQLDLRHVADLQWVAGLSVDQVIALQHHLTFLPEATPVNINTASAEVLSAAMPALDLARARDIVAMREKGQWFTSVSDFLNQLRLPRRAGAQPLSVHSDWFRVSGAVTLDHGRMTVQALMQRSGADFPVIRWADY